MWNFFTKIMNLKLKSYSDIIGIVGSTLCLIHCVATPLLIAIGAGFFASEELNYIFLGVAFFAIRHSTIHTHHKGIQYLLWTGFIGFSLSILLHDYAEWMHDASIVFSILIVIGHLWNLKHFKSCKGTH